MRSAFDFTPYRRSTVGFDRLFDFLESAARNEQTDNYPPFDLEKVSDDRYRITLAVAGFRRDEIDITARQNLLVISGRKGEKIVAIKTLMPSKVDEDVKESEELAVSSRYL